MMLSDRDCGFRTFFFAVWFSLIRFSKSFFSHPLNLPGFGLLGLDCIFSISTISSKSISPSETYPSTIPIQKNINISVTSLGLTNDCFTNFFLSFKAIFQCLNLVETFQKKICEEYLIRRPTYKLILRSLTRLLIILVSLTRSLFSEKMLISNRCISALMPKLIKKSWTVSTKA